MVAVFIAGNKANAEGVVSHAKFPGTALIDDGTLREVYHYRPAAKVVDLHVYTFNQVESTEAWRAAIRHAAPRPPCCWRRRKCSACRSRSLPGRSRRARS